MLCLWDIQLKMWCRWGNLVVTRWQEGEITAQRTAEAKVLGQISSTLPHSATLAFPPSWVQEAHTYHRALAQAPRVYNALPSSFCPTLLRSQISALKTRCSGAIPEPLSSTLTQWCELFTWCVPPTRPCLLCPLGLGLDPVNEGGLRSERLEVNQEWISSRKPEMANALGRT